MRYTIEDIRQMPEGQTFDCKSIHIEPKALANTIVAMAMNIVLKQCEQWAENQDM